MALNQDRNTPEKEGKIVSTPVAANTLIYAGSLVCLNAEGFAVPGSATTGLTYWGRAEERKENTTREDGAVSVKVKRKGLFRWNNAQQSPDTLTQADCGKPCFILDDATVAKTNGSNARSECGIVVQVDEQGGRPSGVWVEAKI